MEWTCRIAYEFFDPSLKKIQRGSAPKLQSPSAIRKASINLRNCASIHADQLTRGRLCHVTFVENISGAQFGQLRYHLFKRTEASKVRPKWPSIFAEVFEPQCIDSTYPLAAAQTRMLRACCQLRLIALSGLAGSNVWNPNCRD